ncbi:MAG: hypothetical protein HYW91_03605 [Candidatus Sungbacteria bacterium]|nr:hypothetical protein [Candidatus Sungbacteria bacterium]
MLKPERTTDRPRKYLAGRRYETCSEIPIFGGGHFNPGTRFSATGQLGSMLYKPCRGKRHPEDLLIEVRKRRVCRQPYVYDTYWISAELFDIPGLIRHIRKVRKKAEIKKNVERALNNIKRCAQSV